MLTLQTPRRYIAYLLRGWMEQGDDPASPANWRFSLEDPHTGQRRGFASLERLTAALAQDCGGAQPVEDGDTSPQEKQ
jgi:rRNA maturation protein Nop10